MHIPDGFLNIPTIVTTQAVALSVLAPAISRVQRHSHSNRIPLMGLSAAFIFTAQLLSFPIPGGTSIHISGAVLISILLGPFSGLVISACALILQALLFQHGGFYSFGANLINMGLIPCLFGYGIYKLLTWNLFFAAAVGTFLSKMAAAVICALELSVSGFVPIKTGLLAMGITHAIGGIIEVAVTLLILSVLLKNRPELLKLKKI